MKTTRVLLIETNPDVRSIVAHRLRQQDFEVETAADGLAALRMLRTGEFEYVLLDLRLPAMNGFGFLRALQRRAAPPPRVFVVAENVNSLVYGHLLRLGASRVLSKGQLLHPDFAAALRRAHEVTHTPRACCPAALERAFGFPIAS